MVEVSPGLYAAEQEILRDVQGIIGAANEQKGFHEDGQKLKLELLTARGQLDRSPNSDAARRLVDVLETALTDYFTRRLMLIVSEAVESHDEFRGGHSVEETYYSEGGKPEGFRSEHADILIRCLDLGYEIQQYFPDYDLIGMVDEKLRYNATRPHKHGKKF